MRIMCDVNQLECLRYGVEALSSTVEIDVDPKLLTLEQRNFVVDNLYEGVRYPRDRELNICPPTYARPSRLDRLWCCLLPERRTQVHVCGSHTDGSDRQRVCGASHKID